MAEATIVTTLRDVEAAARAPGLYLVQAGTEAYFPMMALVEAQIVENVGDSYPRGNHVATIHVPGRTRARENPVEPERRTISIGPEFFITALKDYRDWTIKWWREAVQNAVDAGATEVNLEARENGNNTWTVSCEDNGRGMDESTIINKFLVLGATTKTSSSGTAGGFGKAKELLLLPWVSWEIHSRDTTVSGVGIDYTVSKRGSRFGTKLTVVMPSDKTTTFIAARSFLAKCDLPHVRFTVNGDPIQAELGGGQIIDTVPGKMNVHFVPLKAKETQSYIYVRTKGLYMFDTYAGSEVPGYILAEITAPSIEILTANRDGFRDWEAEHNLRALAARIAKDASDATRAGRGLIKKKYTGTGKFETRSAAARIMEHVGPYRTGVPGKADVAAMTRELDEYARSRENEQQITSSAPAGSARAMLDHKFDGPDQLETAIKQLVWEPDFYLLNEIEDFKVPKKFFPETMTPTVLKLVKVWTELVRYVLIQLGSEIKFGVGLVFSEKMAAAALHEDGEEWIMLNPYKDIDSRKETWRTTDADLKWLYAAAIHEATHVVDRLPDHDREFATALTVNIAKCADGYRKIKQIASGIRMKGAPELAPAASKAEKILAPDLLSEEERWILRLVRNDGAEFSLPEDLRTVRSLVDRGLVTSTPSEPRVITPGGQPQKTVLVYATNQGQQTILRLDQGE